MELHPGDATGALVTCEVCQMRLPWHWGTSIFGVRGGRSWRCAMCVPPELCDIAPTVLAGIWNDIIRLRRERSGGVRMADAWRALAAMVTGA